MILIEVESLAVILRSRGALGTEAGKKEGNNDYVESSHMMYSSVNTAIYVCGAATYAAHIDTE